MSITKEVKNELAKTYGLAEGDTGSPEVQIALLTKRIAEITEHMRSHKKDHSTRKGLLAMVSKRKRLLKYLGNENHEKFVAISAELGIRGQK